MEKFEISNILYYCLFSTFVYYNQLHLKQSRGKSKFFEIILLAFSLIGMITGFGYLITYGYKVSWWAPFVIIIAGFFFMFFAAFIEKLLGEYGVFWMSLIGFIVWPISAYLMFTTIP